MSDADRGRNAHYDDLETRSRDDRETALLAALPGQIGHAKATAPAMAEILSQVETSAITSRAALASLPVIRKADLMRRQTPASPFGDLNGTPIATMAHLFASPGPVYEFDRERPDFWRTARAFFAAGFRPGELVHNSFSYHLTPGGWIMESGARDLGCPVIPAGTGNSEQQVQTIAHFRPSGFSGTPDYLKVLLEKADELGVDMSSITKALVSGGALFPSMRQAYEERGIQMAQCYATADLGLIAYESDARDGMIIDEGLLVEIVRPGSGTPVPDGEVGEVVVTTLNPDYPLIRFATGDLSAILPGQSPCGRSNQRIKGWMGRADQAAKVRGMFVQASQVAELQKRHDEVKKARLVVTRIDNQDVMTLNCEVTGQPQGLASLLERSLQDICKVKGGIRFAAPGDLPNDGLVIEDQRQYD
ncbi:MAG: AMP-binding protein [Pseudomonadota bacterium]